MLNVKQEKFVQNIVKGMSQRQAYKDAYNAKYSDKAIDEKASTLFNLEKVQERYKELIEELKDDAIMDAKERMKWLTKIIKDEIKEKATTFNTNAETGETETIEHEYSSKLDTKLKAIDTLNKMSGEYSQNVKLSGNVHVQEQKNAIDDIVAQMKPVTEDDV